MQNVELPDDIASAIATMVAPYRPETTVANIVKRFSNEQQEEHDLLTKTEAHEMLRIYMPTIDRMIKDGQIEAVRIRGRVFIRRSSIDRFLRGK